MDFEVKLAYEKIMPNGLQKRVTEVYLINSAVSHAEAETIAMSELAHYIKGDIEVVAVKRVKLAEIFISDENADRYYKAKLSFIVLDEKSGMEKKQPVNMLIRANDLSEALDVLKERMQGTMADYEINSISESNIIDIIIPDAASK